MTITRLSAAGVFWLIYFGAIVGAVIWSALA